MTEKQVTLTGIENKWIYSEEEGDYPKITAPDGCFYCFSFSIDAQQLCEKLNEMQDKINQLNDENNILKQQLKTKYIVNKQYEELQRLKEENERLKYDAKQVLFVLSCCNRDFGLTVNEAKAIKRLNECVDGCYSINSIKRHLND